MCTTAMHEFIQSFWDDAISFASTSTTYAKWELFLEVDGQISSEKNHAAIIALTA